jgi:hypothetical protein
VGEEPWVTVAVPASLVRDVYRLVLGAATPPSSGASDRDIITRAYVESSAPTKAFLRLLAQHPDEWLSIDEIREALGLGVHELPGVLSTFPRRWRGRYKQAGPMPYDVDDAGGRKRYRMGKEVAELIASVG